MTERDNILRTVRFEKPASIPMQFHINASVWHHYPQDEVKALMADHRLLFPGGPPRDDPYQPELLLNARAGRPYVDAWGCTWVTTDDGITGSVHGHALESWEAFEGYRPPDPGVTDGVYPRDWNAIAASFATAEEQGRIRQGSLTHGHTFLRLCDLRGYQNLLFDMMDAEPRLWKLIEMVEAFNMGIVRRYMDLDAEWISVPEDLGMQVGPMLSPAQFRTFIKPSYERLMKPARERGIIVHMHSDGDIRTLADDLIEGGVQVINLQDLVNGIDWIAGTFAGKVCIDLDVDRQEIVPRGTPAAIDALVREAVEKLSCREGGLMMIHGWYPGVPLANVRALMDAMERYAGYHA